MAHRGDLTRGLIAGIVAGLVASYVMNQAQKALTALESQDGADAGERDRSATLKAADAIAKSITGKVVPDKAQTAASQAVHYLTGAMLGAVYCAAAEFYPGVTKGFGCAYGTATWLAIDEGIVPLMGFGPPADEVPAKEHAFAFASHAVFGMTLELVRTIAGRRRDNCQDDTPDQARR